MFGIMFKTKDDDVVFDDNEFATEESAITYAQIEMTQEVNLDSFEVVEKGD